MSRLPDRIRRSPFLRRFTRISFSLILHLLREMDTALVSRIRTVLRRTGTVSSVTVLGNLSVDTVRGTVTKNSQELFLSALEYRLLLLFLNNRGKTLTRNVLLEEIWDLAGDYVNDNTLTVYIKRLREKIEDNPQEPTIIKTIRGIGYRLEIPSET